MKLIISFLSLLSVVSLYAYDLEVNGIYYDADVNKMELTVVNGEKPYSGTINIPDSVNYKGRIFSVIRIAKSTFTNTSIVEISIPKSITEIPKQEFKNCENLCKVEFHEGLKYIDEEAFYNCVSLQEIIIPSSVNYICKAAFCHSGIKRLIIQDGITEIRMYSGAFNNLDLEFMYLGRSYKGIDVYYVGVFNDSHINNIKIGPNVEYLPYYGLQYCQIKYIEIPSNVKELGENCFNGSKLEELIITDSTSPLYVNTYYSGGDNSIIISKKLYMGRNIKNTENISSVYPRLTFRGYSEYLGESVDDYELVIGKKVTDLRDIDFGNGLSVITNYNPIPQILGGKTFSDQAYLFLQLGVPYGCIGKYKTADVWKNFFNIVEMSKVEAENLELKIENSNICVGDTTLIKGTIHPANSSDTIQWKSSDTKIATVSNEGVVTAIAPGKAHITAVCGKITAACEVTVLEPNIDIEFSDNKLTVITEGYRDESSIKIFSVLGKCIYKKSVKNGDKIDLLKLNSGTYIVQVISGNINISKRIVKSNK